MNDELVISSYDRSWPELFLAEKVILASIFEPTSAAIEHIGSTAVPDLGAKPIIDVLVGVERLSDAEQRIPKLASVGYQYVSKYESVLPERRYFRKTGWHLHCVLYGSSFWEDHLLFRDYLREHLATAKEYFELKQRLAEKYKRNHRAYTEGKSEFIARVLKGSSTG